MVLAKSAAVLAVSMSDGRLDRKSLKSSVPKLMKGLAILIPNLGWLRFRKVLRIKKRLIWIKMVEY